MLRTAMEPTLILVFLFVVVIIVVQNRAKERQNRLKVLEEALKNGNLDEGTRQELVDALSDRPRHRRRESAKTSPPPAAAPAAEVAPQRSSVKARMAFGLGWIGLFIGIALLAIDDRNTFEAGVTLLCAGFALMSLPIALRELDRPAKSGRRA